MKHEGRGPIVLLKSDIASLIAEGDTLTNAGFAVLEAGRSDEVLSYLESRDDIRAVVTDLSVPGCFDGLELATYVHRDWPQIGVIVLGLPSVAPPGVASFLEKPYAASVLIEQIKRICIDADSANDEAV